MGILDLFSFSAKSTSKVTKYVPASYSAKEYPYRLYQKNFYRLAIACILLAAINLVLAVYAINLYYSKIEQSYYATTYQGELVKIEPRARG